MHINPIVTRRQAGNSDLCDIQAQSDILNPSANNLRDERLKPHDHSRGMRQ